MVHKYSRRFPTRTLAPSGDLTTEISGLPYHGINFRVHGTITSSAGIAKNPYGAFELIDKLDIALGGEEIIHLRGYALQALCELLQGGQLNELVAAVTTNPYRSSAHLDLTKLMPSARLYPQGDQKLEIRAKGSPAAVGTAFQGYGSNQTNFSCTLEASGHSYGGVPSGPIHKPRFDFNDYPVDTSTTSDKYVKQFKQVTDIPGILLIPVDKASSGNNRHSDGHVSRLKVTLFRNGQSPVVLYDDPWTTFRDETAKLFRLPYNATPAENSQRQGTIFIPLIDAVPEARDRNNAMRMGPGDSIELDFDTASAVEAGITDLTLAANEDIVNATWLGFEPTNAGAQEGARRGVNPRGR
jgi:hypothetical protein